MEALNSGFASLSCSGLYRPRPTKLVITGLKNAGKSTLLRNIVDVIQGHYYWEHASCPGIETLIKGNVSTTVFDLGGGGHTDDDQTQSELRTKSAIRGATALMFVVDAHDSESFVEAAEQLHALDAAEELKGVPFLVLGNKIDIPGTGYLSPDRHVGGGPLGETSGARYQKQPIDQGENVLGSEGFFMVSLYVLVVSVSFLGVGRGPIASGSSATEIYHWKSANQR
ncbi:P-loop containing nucleoside triphosphate hydrolase protein [Echria macrotheca]|uniref:P-loop containing nucleoside triphosphate hydrolase protein n=1 Tax=Echria macrotheca TaxID=438768 RepID=A0AAJ0B229_9PEZI|nr:P-loop containing nucleoside triphosphate hydrolase protein [Echria macrotheca]